MTTVPAHASHLSLPSSSYPERGSTTMSRAWSRSRQMSTVRRVPSSRLTSMRWLPASVQYRLRPAQSTARPVGLSRLVPINTCNRGQVFVCTGFLLQNSTTFFKHKDHFPDGIRKDGKCKSYIHNLERMVTLVACSR